MINDKQLKYLQTSGLNPSQIAQIVRAAGGYDRSTQPKTIAGFLGNVASSGANAVGGIGSSLINVFNPNMEKNTVANIARLGVGTAQLLDPTQVLGTGQEETARNVGRFYNQRYGISDLLAGRLGKASQKIGNTLYNDPVGAALDVSSVVGGAGALARGVGNAGKLGGLARAGETLSAASELIDPFSLAGKGVGFASGKIARKVAPALEEASNTILTKGYGQPKQLAKIEGMAGRPTGQLIRDYKLYDRSPETIGRAIDTAGSRYSDAVMAAGKNIDTGSFLKSLDAEIKNLDSQALLSETAKAQRDALVQRRANLEEFLTQQNAVPLQFSPQSAVEMKRNIYQDVKPGTFNPMYNGSGGQMAAKTAYKNLIGAIDEAAPGTRQLGRDQAALIKLQDLAEASAQRGNARQMFNFTKMGGAGVGGIVGGAGGAVAGAAAETLVNHPKFLEAASKGLAGGSQVMRNVNLQPAANIATKTYQVGKGMNQINPGQRTSTSPNTGSPPQIPLKPQVSYSTPKAIVPSPSTAPVSTTPPKGYAPKPIEYKVPKNPFRSSAAFGKTPRIKMSSAV